MLNPDLIQGAPAWAPFVSGVATLLVGGVALAMAITQVRTQRRIAKRRNTIDLIVKFETDSIYQAAFATFKRLARKEVAPGDFIDAKSSAKRQLRDEINAFLNYCELMSLALRRDTIDGEIFYQWWGGPLVANWNYAVETVDALRSLTDPPNRKILVNFEVVARHFAKRKAGSAGGGGGFVESKFPNHAQLSIPDSA